MAKAEVETLDSVPAEVMKGLKRQTRGHAQRTGM